MLVDRLLRLIQEILQQLLQGSQIVVGEWLDRVICTLNELSVSLHEQGGDDLGQAAAILLSEHGRVEFGEHFV